MTIVERLSQRLFRPVDAASLVFFRVAFGSLMLIEVWRYFSHGWIHKYFIQPEFHFKYYGFEWVQPWPGSGMYWHFAALGLLAACIALGAFYRVATVLFFLAFSYVFLLDQAQYLNHFYLVILVSALMCVLPAHRAFSVDARLRANLQSPSVPAWAVWALVLLFEIVLIYAGLVKVNADWLQLEPLRSWLAKRAHLPIAGWFFTQDWAVAVGAYGVIALHLIGAPLLLWKRTRFCVFVLYCCFHLMNAWVFEIGIFPWLTIFGTLMFFEPDWPRRMERRLASLGASYVERRAGAAPGSLRMPVESALTERHNANALALEHARSSRPSGRHWLLLGLLGLGFAVQILFPLRHWLYPGNVSWTEEGHRFAWQMKLRDKRGSAVFTVRNPITGQVTRVTLEEYLTLRQARKTACRPDMILQFAHYLAGVWQTKHFIDNAEVRVSVQCSLNGRRRARLIDPNRDLAKVERDLRTADWILPLNEPLRGTDPSTSSIVRKRP